MNALWLKTLENHEFTILINVQKKGRRQVPKFTEKSRLFESIHPPRHSWGKFSSWWWLKKKKKKRVSSQCSLKRTISKTRLITKSNLGVTWNKIKMKCYLMKLSNIGQNQRVDSFSATHHYSKFGYTPEVKSVPDGDLKRKLMKWHRNVT